ncbi:SpaA isopeptide-forming pilin-related protein [Bifidobacterium miconisargentati]|uniref:SpaA isopeptide-forming pilin-related protein n=1 Tax=Bifidobacterium miconisargentati TaxID=2834437 RepID=UPI001BDD60C9|nr:SpaA isopeptide-forming pilin-related protein [Bifidobacterium miconisargentati]MBW3090030.1 hypothetical protein [Bifidobacterium miconisargentati]
MMRNVDVARRMRAGAAAVACAAMLAGGLTVAANAEDAYTVKDAAGFVSALTCTAADAARTVTIAENITVTDGDVGGAGKHISANCPVTIVSDGAARTVTWAGTASMLWRDGNAVGSLTIGAADTPNGQGGNALTFTHPDDKADHGPIMHSYGTVAIHGGTFTGLRVGKGGVVQNDGTLTIDGGLFQGNTASDESGDTKIGTGGGVIYQSQGSTTITGGEFRDNVAAPTGCTSDDDYSSCKNYVGGGGALFSKGGSVTIGGNVVFDHNGATAAHFNSGGGAIWVQGTLTIRNGRDGSSRPTFTNNWAVVADPKNRNLENDGILRGGAGGAVFLNNGSNAYITGGRYTGNVSGYLGGAIYTEEGTTTYVGKAVAWKNIAGHFGGGLWFCPSGSAAASKGGNIALFGNTVNADYDANPDNKVTPLPVGATSTTAGADLAIMNPWYKNHDDTQFELLDTWFTNRSEAAVTWQWDGTPLKESSGYHDSWLHTANSVTQGINAVLADNAHQGEQKPAVVRLTKGTAPAGSADYYDTGLALKAEVKDGVDTQAAIDGAQLTMTGNYARLSGGAFGSDGVVVFDSPYSMDWNKTDSVTGLHVKGKSTWRLSIRSADLTDRDTSRTEGEKTPYFDVDMRPSNCQATNDTKNDYCWGETNGIWTVLIEDNDDLMHDNNRQIGSLSLDNLAPGTYTLEEVTPPDGYVKSDKKYMFTIVETAQGSLPKPPVLYVLNDDGTQGDEVKDSNVDNTPKTGFLEWSKTDSVTGGRLPGSEWKITDADGNDVENYTNITDCATGEGGSCDALLGDQDPMSGKFSIRLGDGYLPAGSYRLVETKAPEGHFLSKDATHAFTVTANGDKYEATWDGVETGTIENIPTSVSWTKVGSDYTSKALAGSTWKLTGPDGTETDITDCVKQDACKAGGDRDATAGVFRLIGLKAGKYTLTETNAPEGYVKSDKTYTFEIKTDDPNATVAIYSDSDMTDAVTDNKIVNQKQVSVLPLTGGSALDWLVTGGVLALLALASALVMGRMRGRAGVR